MAEKGTLRQIVDAVEGAVQAVADATGLGGPAPAAVPEAPKVPKAARKAGRKAAVARAEAAKRPGRSAP